MTILLGEYEAEAATLDAQKDKIYAEKQEALTDNIAIQKAAQNAIAVLDDFELDLEIFDSSGEKSRYDKMEDTMKTEVDLARGGGATGKDHDLNTGGTPTLKMKLDSGVEEDMPEGMKRELKVDGTLVASGGTTVRDGALVTGALQPYLKQVVTMIRMVESDATKTIADAETEWATFHQVYVKSSADLANVIARLKSDIQTSDNSITDSKQSIATKKQTIVGYQEQLKTKQQQYDANEKACDMAGKMAERHERIRAEIQALKEASAILSGSTTVGS